MNNPFNFTELFKNPFDVNQLMNVQRRNWEALSAANQAMVEGAQAITRRQAEIVRENMEKTLQASRDMMSGGSSDGKIAKQSELARDTFENTVNHIREVTEMATKSTFEAFDVLNKRATESLEEVTQAANTTAQPKRKSA